MPVKRIGQSSDAGRLHGVDDRRRIAVVQVKTQLVLKGRWSLETHHRHRFIKCRIEADLGKEKKFIGYYRNIATFSQELPL
jgi:hypothetical protein